MLFNKTHTQLSSFSWGWSVTMAWGFWDSTPPSGSSQTSAASSPGKIALRHLWCSRCLGIVSPDVAQLSPSVFISKSISVSLPASACAAFEILRKPDAGDRFAVSSLLPRKVWTSSCCAQINEWHSTCVISKDLNFLKECSFCVIAFVSVVDEISSKAHASV